MYNGISGITLIHVDTSAISAEDSNPRLEFLCDTTDDTQYLPTEASEGLRPGSTAVDAETGNILVLKDSRAWGILVEGA